MCSLVLPTCVFVRAAHAGNGPGQHQQILARVYVSTGVLRHITACFTALNAYIIPRPQQRHLCSGLYTTIL